MTTKSRNPGRRQAVVPFVLDDDPELLGALETMLSSIGLECETYSDPQRFLAEADFPRCGCLILDLRMPLMSGLEVQSALRQRGIDVPVIFLSGHGDIPTAIRALQGGAVDFIEKPFRPQELLDRINECLRKERPSLPPTAALPVALSPRETDVARAIVAGKTSAEMAAELGLSKRTIDMHRSRLLRRLNVRRSAQALPLLRNLLGTPEKTKPAHSRSRSKP